ncbi:hypothetical protein E1301_Tti024286 [Triplophysa tibetana]|uniref:Reverse transcriptase zinc-binding domain-containing protein n=1 Tax=Triplophysa tibetana TaxID=1572043 RepID=A0A5A9MRL0_9TELE|nr:hypothetical protein E1301_Tti024286 [Triplophysa tibetana]
MLSRFGPIIRQSIKIWKAAEKTMGASAKYCKPTPIWHNTNLCMAKKILIFKPWTESGIFNLKDIYNDDGLKPFQILQDEFSIPRSSFSFYLRLRLALKTYGVPWSAKLAPHPLINWIDSSMGSKGSVSKINEQMVVHQYIKMPIENFWERELNTTTDWDTVWKNCFTCSKNPAHQMIHFKLIHKAYTTPWLLCKMNRKQNPFCHLCEGSNQGTYMHMFWYCPRVTLFWSLVQTELSVLMDTVIQREPLLFLLLDDSSLSLSLSQRRILTTALTAAKKVILKLWLEPSIPVMCTWRSYLLDIARLESTTARILGASGKTIQFWRDLIVNLSDKQ